MDYSKIGALLRTLRLEKGMTQAMLAEKLHLTPKTISKWERGQGCPDVSLLGALSEALDVEIGHMLEGALSSNEISVGNMRKTRYFVCPCCASISLSSGDTAISCCGRKLAPLEMRRAAPEQALHTEAVEDEWLVTGEHPMTKENYISFVAFQSGDRVELIKQYPEWELQLRLKRRGHGLLIWYAMDTGLLYQPM